MSAGKLFGAVLATIAALCIALLYARGVLARSWIIEHHAFDTFASPDGQYRLEYAASPHFNWMRLYRSGQSEVIADRRFWGEVPYQINWYEKSVYVATSDQSAISLPPHWWERWTAKLP